MVSYDFIEVVIILVERFTEISNVHIATLVSRKYKIYRYFSRYQLVKSGNTITIQLSHGFESPIRELL